MQYVSLLLISLCLMLLACWPVLAASQVERIYGMNQFQTAVQVAYKMNPGKVDTIVLANGNGFADALAGVPLARQKNAPLLLVNETPDTSNDALLYIQKHLDPNGQIYLLGGTGVISNAFIDSLRNLGFDAAQVSRLAGADRYMTAVQIAKEMKHDGTEFFIVSGEDYPDAISASTPAALLGAVSQEEAEYLHSQGEHVLARLGGVPILLTPSHGPVPDSIADYLNSLNPWLGKQVFNVVGGTAAVSPDMLNQLFARMKYSGVIRTRYQGDDRYATSAAVNRIGYEAYYQRLGMGGIIPRVYVASGNNYTDALNGALLAAVNHAPLVLVSNSVEESTLRLLREYAEKNQAHGYTRALMTVIGTAKDIPDEVVQQLNQAYSVAPF